MTAKIEHLRAIGVNSLMLHYPPWYGADKAIASLEAFASDVIPKFRRADGAVAKAELAGEQPYAVRS